MHCKYPVNSIIIPPSSLVPTGAVFHFKKAQGITQAEVEKTLLDLQNRSRKAAHGRVSTIKLCLGTVSVHVCHCFAAADLLQPEGNYFIYLSPCRPGC